MRKPLHWVRLVPKRIAARAAVEPFFRHFQVPFTNAQKRVARSNELNQDKLRSLLAQLQKELDNGATLDNETIALLKKLDRNVDAMIESAGNDNAPVMDDAIALEARFAADHPVAERVIRELIDTLGKMGI